ncbi:MAG: pyrroline-5-carboxylate reductase [Actinomycetales bacterium]|nr:pyrroline-5-carboxylate reductase [Actinomycetales bacterium]
MTSPAEPPVVLPRIAVLGAGSMGGAIVAGVVESGATVEGGITAVNRTRAKADALALPGVESLALEEDPGATSRALAGARLVLVGVKPAGVPALLDEIREALEPGALVVSIAAGVTIATMEARVPNPVVRTMPNTPSTVRRGVTGVAAGDRVDAAGRALVHALFETVGTVVELPEDRIDALGTVAGSGPAYVFLLMEEMTAAARAMGFDAADARTLVEETFAGASALLAASDVDPAELRRRVTSPKGSTERAIAVYQAAGLAGMFEEGMRAALARSREMAAEAAGA